MITSLRLIHLPSYYRPVVLIQEVVVEQKQVGCWISTHNEMRVLWVTLEGAMQGETFVSQQGADSLFKLFVSLPLVQVM